MRLTRAEVDSNQQGQGRNKSRAELQAPRDGSGVLDCQVGTGTQPDSKRSPHLPTHDQTASNCSRGVLRAEDRDDRAFATHANAQQQSGNEQLLPRLRNSRSDGTEETEDRRREDGPATTKIVVERIRDPATAVR